MERDHSPARVLVWAPKGRNATLALQLLARNGLGGEVCGSVDELCDAMDETVSCVVTTEEILRPDASRRVGECLARQPAWSDLPFIVFRPIGMRRKPSDEVLRSIGNVSLLDRPVRARAFLGVLHGAIRSRARQQQARDAINHRDLFLAMLGHELRNPLAAIAAAAELIEDGDDLRNQPPRETVMRQTQNLTRLVDELLDVSRVTSDKITLSKTRVDLNQTIPSALQLNRTAANKKDQTLMFEPSADPLFIDGDALRLEQIFNNLIHNGVKYTPEGGHITVTARRDGDVARILVTDDGVGISSEMLPRIFELFTQVTSSIARSQGGLGIGLTLVKRLVELHRGEIAVTSDGLGAGSSFEVRLPLSGVAGANVEADQAPQPRTALPLKVVLVDDNEDIRSMLKALLQRMGCDVRTGDDGLSGIAAFLEHRPDVGFVDIGLPGIDGYEVARRIRAELGEAPLLIAVTGYGQPDDAARTREAGFDEHITKPATKAALQSVLDRARARLASM